MSSSMSNSTTQTDRRFYDRETLVSNLINTVVNLPEVQIAPTANTRGLVARCISLLAIKDFQANDKLTTRKSLGKEIVLSMYKSKQKKREYDTDNDIHDAVNYLHVLSPEERLIVSTKAMDVIQYIDHYVNICQTTKIPPEEDEMKSIRDQYVVLGENAARRYIESIAMDRLKQTAPSEAKALPKNVISFDDNKIRYDNLS